MKTSAVACVREFYTAYGTDDDSKVQEAINDIYKNQYESKGCDRNKRAHPKRNEYGLKRGLRQR